MQVGNSDLSIQRIQVRLSESVYLRSTRFRPSATTIERMPRHRGQALALRHGHFALLSTTVRHCTHRAAPISISNSRSSVNTATHSVLY